MARHQRDTEKDGPGSVPHWCCTATLVDPRGTPPASVNRTKIRFNDGANETVLVPVTEMPKVGVAFVLMVVTNGLAVGGFTHFASRSMRRTSDRWRRKKRIPVTVFIFRNGVRA